MKNAQLRTILARMGTLLTTLFVVIVPALRAQEAPKEGVRRLTPAQAARVGEAGFVKLVPAYKLFSEGKPADAIPLVKQVIAVEREVLKEAASNPVDDELPRSRDPFARSFLARSAFGDFTDRLMQERAERPTYRNFQWECRRSLELLEQLHETLGDFQSAKAVSAELADIAASLLGAANWATVQARADVDRLGRLAALDRDHARTIETACRATALIASSRGPLGTAFCIDPQGLFLTLDEVAVPPSASVTTHFEYEGGALASTREERSQQTSPMGVVLNLGGPDVKTLPIRVLWRDKQSRLALLKADSKEPLPALELAGAAKFVSGKEATALGLAFVNRTPLRAAGPTPTVRARPGRITSIREKRGKPWFYQLESCPPLGYSGGPVVDEHGRVIGVVVVGKPGTDIHYIVPVDAESASFARVAVEFEPPPLLFRDRHQARDWTVRLYSRTPLSKDATVEIRVGSGANARVYPGREMKDRLYTARVVPVVSGEPDLVELVLETEAGPVRATVADREVLVGQAAIRLSELRRIEHGPTLQVLTADGRRLTGPITGLAVLEGRVGAKVLMLDAQRTRRILLQCPAAYAGQVEAEVVVRNGADVLGRARTALSYTYPPFETSRKIDPANVGLAAVPPPVEPADVRLATASVSREPASSGGDRAHSLGGVHYYSPAVSSDGRLYADGGDDNTIQLFDAASGQMLRKIKLDAWVQSIDFSPDGRTLLAAAYQKQLHLLEVDTGRDLGRFADPHEPGLGQSVLSPDGRLAVSIHDDGKLLLWDVPTGTVLRRLAERSRSFGFRFTPDSRNLLVAGMSAKGATLRLCDARGDAVAWTIPLPGNAAPVFVGCDSVGTNRFHVAYESGAIVWGNLADGKEVRRITVANPIRDGCVALSPDGRNLLLGHPDNCLRLWDASKGALFEQIPLAAVPTGPPKFSPDGKYAIANSFRGSLIVLRTAAMDGPAAPLARPLPGKIASLAVGGAGRYLLLQIKDQRRLAIFDAHRADISALVELADDDALVTANAEKAFVAYPTLRVIDRIDLKTARLDRTAAFPCNATPRAIVAGSASLGPLLSVFHSGAVDEPYPQPVLGFLDPVSLELVAPRIFRREDHDRVESRSPVLAQTEFARAKQGDFRASASGDLYCSLGAAWSRALILKGDTAEDFPIPGPVGTPIPDAAGRSFLVESGRIGLTGPVSKDPSPRGFGVLSTCDPAYYAMVQLNAGGSLRGKPSSPVLEIHSAVSNRRLFVINGLDEMALQFNNELVLNQRYHVIPSARLLVTIPTDNNRLVLRRLDIRAELDRLGIDEIVVTSAPVVTAIAGEALRHRVEAYSKGNVVFEHAEGPPDLSVSPQGELRWDVPTGIAGQEKVAVVTVRSASGQKVLHTVQILVRGRR